MSDHKPKKMRLFEGEEVEEGLCREYSSKVEVRSACRALWTELISMYGGGVKGRRSRRVTTCKM